ncbi:MAG TPA: glycosyltransferase [Candidatus Binataceae bacterium]|nr:glycosyltransferase [Candidatus Binataceae bacterium]
MAVGKKLLFILPNLNGGGAERVTMQLLVKLQARGFEPTLLVIRRKGALLTQIPPQLRVLTALEADEAVYLGGPAFLRKLFRLARDADAVIGALEHEACYFAWLAARMTRKPVIGWIHAVMGNHLPEVARIHTTLARQIYPRMDRLVFPSRGSADSLAAVARLDPCRVAIIPSYIDVVELQSRAEQALPDWAVEVFRKPTILSAGRLVHSKGLDVLIGRHAQLRRTGIDHNLLILGEGPLRPELEALARRLGVESSVFMPGFMENPYKFMKRATVFVLASRFESLATVILEAMAIGCAVVATDCPGGVREILLGAADGRTRVEPCGRLVRVDDQDALGESIAKLLNDDAMRRSLAVSAGKRVRNYSAEVLIPRWEQLLSELI